MGYIYSGLVSLAVAMLVFILQGVIRENRRLKKEKEQILVEQEKAREKRQQAVEDGMVCLLRKELIAEHERNMAKGFITSKALEAGLRMYEAYKQLGGNGMMDHMKAEIEDLPINDSK